MFTMLASRSDFSLGESIVSAKDLVAQAQKVGQKAVAVTDTMSITGLVDLSTKASDAGIKPIIGVRLRVSEDALWRPDKALKQKKKDMPPAFFVTLYARSEAALKAIYRLLTLANDEDHFYYVSKLGWSEINAELNALAPTDFALVLGDEQGVYQHRDFDVILADAMTLHAKGTCCYLPIVAVNTPYYGRINQISATLHKAHDLPLLAIRPSYYGEGEADAQEIMTAICENTKASDGYFRSRHNRDMHPMDLKSFVAEAKACATHLVQRGIPDAGLLITKALQETVGFVSSFAYTWEKQAPSLPKLAADEFKAVSQECSQGFKDRFKEPMFGHIPTTKEQMEVYLPRLKYELGVLEKLGFAPYFLTVQDIVRYAKSNGILVGPGRGSVGGSLVAYLMGITDIDPIRFGLLFERFINPERLDLPDADLDFMSERRHEIVEYLVGKFGADHVAGVSNFGTLGAPSAMRDVGRVMGLPEREYSVSKFVPKLHGQTVDLPTARNEVSEIADFANKHVDIWPIMERLEGSIRNMSQHAAGIVVAGAPLTNFAVVEKRKESAVVNWDKRVIEEQGLVKIDLLGLTTLDVIKLAADYVKEGTGKDLKLNQIPLDDPAVLKAFAEGKTTGIFQFESGGMKKLLRDLGSLTGTVTFEDITACTALYRPGPMESGMMDSFAKRKRGDESVEYIHPVTEDFTSETYGILVYQEQVMKVAQFVAGYTGPEADKLRKIMGKKLPEEMAKQRQKFVDGCVATVGADKDWADDLFSKIEGWAGYGFNKSHAAAYSLISYQAMYLKVNHPLEFYAATMTMLGEAKLLGLMRDAKSQGVNIVFPDINKSSARFELVRYANEIVIPFQRIKGISVKTAEAILTARDDGNGLFKSKEDFINRVQKRACNARAQDALCKVGAFAGIEPSQLSANDPARIKDQVQLLPGLVSDYVPIGREMHRDKATRETVLDLVDDYRTKHGPGAGGDGLPCKPHFGRSAKIMVVTDAPNAEEDANGVMGIARAYESVNQSMLDVDLTMADVYWTSLIKRPKSGKQVNADEISTYKPYFERELDILKPTVIVLLGSQAVRTMLPTFRGKASDAAGEVLYFEDLDANVVIGFNAGEIYHAPEKQEQMDKVWSVVKELTE
ncbi:DNA polymerase III subunit alpha [Rhodobacteraceae bacterium R_SAG4]|nr:DNA polymerase III subunit alpha [Rhodobacteraceae bacterium R_SAG4]